MLLSQIKKLIVDRGVYTIIEIKHKKNNTSFHIFCLKNLFEKILGNFIKNVYPIHVLYQSFFLKIFQIATALCSLFIIIYL
ncbi:hypothetical protein CER18_01400 [Bartonella tribocorum]|uniref:Uncharacterized protein n=1 Tax=Bartonella tribocorum TaxID=85701 RepID=A0A2M6UV05_9HYPH|nr:hypothetical protein CER18_01400 [Bartonella tribocorum]